MCCGNEIKRIGETEGFESMVEEFHEMVQEFQARAHGDRLAPLLQHFQERIRRDALPGTALYPVAGRAARRGKLALPNEVRKKVTYHDPCFLGKHNQIYDEPRHILQSIPGVEFEDLDRSRERSVCCEGGGGRMWAEGTNIEERLAHQRVRDAVGMGAEVLAVACPFCLLTLEDAVKILGLDDKLQVMDIMELVAQAM